MTAGGVLGRQGEEWARTYFLKQHYEILEQNWTFDRAEVDLILYQDETLIFVEVKTRSGQAFGKPEEFVDAAKQKVKDKVDLVKSETDWPTMPGGEKVEPNVFDLSMSEEIPILNINISGDYPVDKLKELLRFHAVSNNESHLSNNINFILKKNDTVWG